MNEKLLRRLQHNMAKIENVTVKQLLVDCFTELQKKSEDEQVKKGVANSADYLNKILWQATFQAIMDMYRTPRLKFAPTVKPVMNEEGEHGGGIVAFEITLPDGTNVVIKKWPDEEVTDAAKV